MTDFIGYNSWGSAIVLDVVLDLLEDARDELRAADDTVNVERSQGRRGAGKLQEAKTK